MLEAHLLSFPTLPTLPTKHSARSQAIGTASRSRFVLLEITLETTYLEY